MRLLRHPAEAGLLAMTKRVRAGRCRSREIATLPSVARNDKETRYWILGSIPRMTQKEERGSLASGSLPRDCFVASLLAMTEKATSRNDKK